MSTKRILIIFILLILAMGLGLFYFLSRKEDHIYPTSGTNIIIFGDSLVEGYGVSSENNFVSLLSKRIGREIINEGVSGDTTQDGLARIYAGVLNQDPRVVIVLLGGNDAIRRIPEDQTFNNLEKIINLIHGEGSAVILVGVRGGLLRDKYSGGYKELAKKTGVFFISNILDDIFGNPEFMADPIHPNEKGHVMMADRIEPVLRRVLDNAK